MPNKLQSVSLVFPIFLVLFLHLLVDSKESVVINLDLQDIAFGTSGSANKREKKTMRKKNTKRKKKKQQQNSTIGIGRSK
jgi:hypothetical protein